MGWGFDCALKVVIVSIQAASALPQFLPIDDIKSGPHPDIRNGSIGKSLMNTNRHELQGGGPQPAFDRDLTEGCEPIRQSATPHVPILIGVNSSMRGSIESLRHSLNISHSLRLCSLAPGLSPVEAACGDVRRFNGFPRGVETAEAVEVLKRPTTTGLKPGANERL